MVLNKKFLLLITVVFIASVGIVVAEDATVGPYTFTVPDGYTIATSDDTSCAMQLDEYKAISFATGVSDDLEAAKQNFIDQGQTLIDEKEMEYNGLPITLQAFSIEKDGTTFYVYNYVCLNEDGNFVVTATTNDADFDSDLNSDSNPAKIIFDTLQVN
ncbi:hypothetical protein [Methanobrevibacter sp.]|uniref:hypothetical protein n=1 Tax=Methanobrevibacter sp. TaxID=66852 RepID=UPI002708F45A|nr:hypothetical protein [Methanobrevibacter sp.]